MVREIQRINPSGLYDPSQNGYTHIAIAPPGSTIVYIAGGGGENEFGELAPDASTNTNFHSQAGTRWHVV